MFLVPAAHGDTVVADNVLTFPGGGVVSGGGWDTFRIESIVTFVEDKGWYSYQYYITNNVPPDYDPLEGPGLSHFILEVSASFGSDDLILDLDLLESTLLITEGGDNAVLAGPEDWGPHASNPGLGSTFFGIKFDDLGDGAFSFYFESYRDPVLGNFYGKGGTDTYAYNLYIDDQTGGRTELNSIWVPDSDLPSIVVPVPPAAAIGLLGMGILGLVRARSRKRSA
jgi:hypothetical protein